MNNNNDKRLNLMADVYLILFLTAMAAVAVLFGFMPHYVLLNTVYLGIAILSILITYFFGIIPGLIENLIFIFAQAIVMLYLNQTTNHVPLGLALWLLVPSLLSFIFYGMTTKQQQLQKRNEALRTTLAEQGAFDADTSLRTTVAFLEDAKVFIENNKRFDLPVAMVVFRIRYYNELRRMMTDVQLRELLKNTSKIITSTTRDNDVAYYLDNTTPTWGIILHTDEPGAHIAADRIKNAFSQQLPQSGQLQNMNITLITGISGWDSETMTEPYDLVNKALKETEYDV